MCDHGIYVRSLINMIDRIPILAIACLHACFVELRLAAILCQADHSTGIKALKAMEREQKKDAAGTLLEIKMLDRSCIVGFGQGLEKFIPSYFASGVTCLQPGSVLGPLPPLHQRPMLRLVSDREATNNAAQGYITSRCRALEVIDPFHILWRICLQGLNKSGCRGTSTSYFQPHGDISPTMP